MEKQLDEIMKATIETCKAYGLPLNEVYWRNQLRGAMERAAQ